MIDLVSFIDSIRQYLLSTNIEFHIDLPEILVVGEQSSGKSSILESLIGKDILPKGTGVVTKRPILIQMIQTNDSLEYAEFHHLPGRKITNFTFVFQELCKLNEAPFEGNTQISEEPIYLKIYSNKYLNMTLIDLPGLTKISVGNQPLNISDNIRKLISKYLQNQNAIYLAIIPAIIDIVNSEALKIIKEFDPEFKRTIGVLTKIDLMDSGTNCVKILLNKVVYLSLGWIGVVNRSFNDLKMGKSFQDSRQTEKLFFENHPIYRRLSNKCGTIYLQKKIHKIFIAQIEQFLPILKMDINNRIDECESEMKRIRPFISYNSKFDEANFVIIAVKEFYKRINEDMGTSYLSVRLEGISNGVIIENCISKFPELCKNKFPKNMDLEIQMGIENATGLPGYVEIPDTVIRSLVRSNIEVIRTISVEIIQSLYSRMIESIKQCCISKTVYSNLNHTILSISMNFISEAENRFQKIIQFFIDCERDHINFHHPDFIFCYRTNEDIRASSRSLCSDGSFIMERFYAEIQNKKLKNNHKNVVLSIDGYTLWIYSNDSASDLIGTVALKGCAIKPLEKGSKSVGFILTHKTNKYVLNNMKQLDFKFQNEENMIRFKENVMEIINSASSNYNSEYRIDLLFKVERIKTLVEKYSKIVVKNIHDLITKYCHFLFIQGFDNFIQNQLTYHILNHSNMKELLKIDHSEQEKIDSLKFQLEKLSDFRDWIDNKLTLHTISI